MAEPLVVNLLGPPRFAQAEVVITCASRKAVGLFAYLMLSTRSHARRELAALLWGRRDEETARASLRVALHRLPAAMAECLRVDRDTIEVASVPLVDVARFEALAKSDDLASLDQATELYQGELLQDFEADATPEFDDWLHAQRTRLAQVAQQAFDASITRRTERARHDAARATGERESALATGRRWIALMPGSEAAHRWLMQLYFDMGRRDAALAQYELCQRSLAVTYGRTPSAATRDLYETALGRAAGTQTAGEVTDTLVQREAVTRSLVPATSFVGRIEELAELDRLLADPGCRLLTLHGLGGAGKTRLAHALATQVGARFAQGITWVALEAAEPLGGLPAAIATAIGRDPPVRGDRAEQVAAMLAGQQRLLVLDNLETLLAQRDGAPDIEPAAVIAKILELAPLVRVVATSREVVGLQEEWVYEVHGLPLEAAAGASAPAIELFAQRARQAYLGFSLSAEMPHVLRIATLVEGLPLGLELAAAWVRTIPCGEIAAAIERTAAEFASRHRDRAARHRNLDAVVAYSWDLLSAEQQNALAGLAVFAGGFTREAAERVADASLRTLSVLVDKSLVRRRPDGRYDLHEIVRQFALARLAKKRSRHAAAMRKHAELFAELATRLSADMRGPGEAAADATFAIELPNLLAAYDRSVNAGWREVVERMASPLTAMLQTRGRVPVAFSVGERAVALLEDSGHDDVLALIRAHYARAAMTVGTRMDVAEREVDAAVALARRGGKASILARCLYYVGALAYQRNEVEKVNAILVELMPLAEKTNEPELVALACNLAGGIANLQSRFPLAEAHLRKAVAAAREFGAPSLIAGSLCGLGPALYYQGNFDEAVAVNEEALALFAMLGRNTILPMLRSNIAGILLAKGDPVGALPHAQAAVDLAREMGDRNALGGALVNAADTLFRLGRMSEVRAVAEEALSLGLTLGSMLEISEALFLLACVALGESRHADALAHILDLRDQLARNRLEVRVPMLIVAAAHWVAAADRENWPRARYWLAGLAGLEDIDATLRDRAKALLVREGEADAVSDVAATLAEIEADVQVYLAAVAQG